MRSNCEIPARNAIQETSSKRVPRLGRSPPGKAGPLQVLADDLQAALVPFHEKGVFGAAGEGFEADGPGPGVKVQEFRPEGPRAEDVE